MILRSIKEFTNDHSSSTKSQIPKGNVGHVCFSTTAKNTYHIFLKQSFIDYLKGEKDFTLKFSDNISIETDGVYHLELTSEGSLKINLVVKYNREADWETRSNVSLSNTLHKDLRNIFEL